MREKMYIEKKKKRKLQKGKTFDSEFRANTADPHNATLHNFPCKKHKLIIEVRSNQAGIISCLE